MINLTGFKRTQFAQPVRFVAAALFSFYGNLLAALPFSRLREDNAQDTVLECGIEMALALPPH